MPQQALSGIHPGSPWPLGSSLTSRGVNFVLATPGADRIELYTESFAVQHVLKGREAAAPFATAAGWAHDAGLGVNAGHDLNLSNLRDFAESVPHLDEVSIGHALISDALYLGMSNAVSQYRACLHTP